MMKLFYGPNSPFARKCRIVALEKGLQDRIEFIAVDAMGTPPELLAVNPLGTVPALITADGMHLADSTVICEYLDGADGKPIFHPQDGSRLCVMAMAVMADGIMDAAVQCVLESRRPEEKKYAAWVERKQNAILRAINKFAALDMEQSSLSIGTLNLAVALAYVDFRLPHLPWRSQHPSLAAWLDSFQQRPAMLATRPAL